MIKKRKRGPTNPIVASLAGKLRSTAFENDAPVWRSVSKFLDKPRRNRTSVNLSKIARHTNKDDTVVIPGKVLATGELSNPVTIAALSFSERAREKIEAAKGRALKIDELIEENPKGSKVRILR